jgi:transporter family-2 protein
MYHLLSLLTGALITAMIAVNGGLTALAGTYKATVIIHIVGLALISVLVLRGRERPLGPFPERIGRGLYLGGAVGVLTTVCNNLAFGRISVSAILALGLLGQSVAGLAVDQTGWMGMPRYPFRVRKLWGLALLLGGIAAMIDRLEPAAVALSFVSGACIVVSRTLCAGLAKKTSVNISTFYNYVVGLAVSVPVLLALGGGEPAWRAPPLSADLFLYTGGILGVAVVALSNLTVARLSAFTLTLLVFVSQIFTGLVLDAVLAGAVSARSLAGGALVTAGLTLNLLLDRGKAEEPAAV